VSVTVTVARPAAGLSLSHGIALYVGAVLGTGVIALPALAARVAGPASLIAWLALVIASIPLAATFAALGARHPDSGGVSTYARRAFGPRAAAVVGWWFYSAVPAGAPAAALFAGAYVESAFGGGKATVFLTAAPIEPYPAEFYQRGLTAIVLDEQKLNPYDLQAGHKTLNYLSRLAALREANRRGAGEALWFNVHNYLQSGSISNVFIVKGIAAWLFHGADDTTVPVTESRQIVAALKQVGSPVRYSEYEGVVHNAWDRAFAEPELPKWLFAQRRGAKPAS